MVGELSGDDGETDHERRIIRVLRLFKLTCDNTRSVGSHLALKAESSGSHDWKLAVDAALKRAAKESGFPNSTPEQVITFCDFILREPRPYFGSVTWAWRQMAISEVCAEMDKLNRLGTPDDYHEAWGCDAAEQRERERAVKRTVQAAEMTA